MTGIGHLLHVEVSVFNEPATGENWLAVAPTLVSQALAHGCTLPLCGVLLFSTADWCQDSSHTLPKIVRAEFRSHLGYETQLIGGSMPRLFASVPKDSGQTEIFVTSGVVAISLFSRDLWFAVRSVEDPHSLTVQERRDRLSSLATELHQARVKHMGLGSSVQLDILAILPGPRSFDAGRQFRDEELHVQLLDAFEGHLHVFGASSGDAARSLCGYQFANDQCLKSGLAIALMENGPEQGSALGHGFQLHPGPAWTTVTALDHGTIEPSYRVAELDHRPAATVLNEWATAGILERGRPILGIGTNPRCQIAATVDNPPFKGSVHFNRRLHLGTPLFVLQGDDGVLRKGAVGLLEECRTRTGTPDSLLRLFLVFCCAGRFQSKAGFDDNAWALTMSEMAKAAHHTPLVCLLCTGEFAEDHRHRPRADSYSVWAACLTSRRGRRSDTRLLQSDLLRTYGLLGECTTPDQVMDTSLEGALRAGAEGGQICLADKFIGLILGTIGRSRNRPGSCQRWDLVLPETIINLPQDCERVILPEHMRANSVHLGDPRPEASARTLTDSDDILEVCALERCALFVPDSNARESHCNRARVILGSLEAQFVAPLIGSGGTLIGTMQIGFPRDQPMDQERIGMWVAFSQQTAAALERALEREERERLEAVTDSWTTVLQLHTPLSDSEHLLQQFTTVVKNELKAIYVHLRVREVFSGAVRYRLVAPAGELGDLHRRVRPYISSDQGSVAIALNEKMRFTNRHDDTTKMYCGAFLHSGGDLDQSWNDKASKMKSAAIIELRYGEEFLGALVVDSEREFFFRERTKRLAEVAAHKAAALISKLHAETALQKVINTSVVR